MKSTAQVILVLEAGAAVSLVAAAMQGDASLRANGLHVPKLAYDHIAWTVLAVCIISCVLSGVVFARVVRSWERMYALEFIAAVVIGALAVSAFANASDRVSFNGASVEWVSWPASLWLLGLVVGFALRACEAVRPESRGAEP